jgi:hypothetical protein
MTKTRGIREVVAWVLVLFLLYTQQQRLSLPASLLESKSTTPQQPAAATKDQVENLTAKLQQQWATTDQQLKEQQQLLKEEQQLFKDQQQTATTSFASLQ